MRTKWIMVERFGAEMILEKTAIVIKIPFGEGSQNAINCFNEIAQKSRLIIPQDKEAKTT